MSTRERAFFGASALAQVGRLSTLGWEVLRAVPRRPFQFREWIQQCWFIASVTILPTALVAIPFGAVIALQLGSLTQQIGAQSFTGAASALAIVQQASPLITALLVAGAGGSAVCADIGARKIREEIARRHGGVGPAQRPGERGRCARRLLLRTAKGIWGWCSTSSIRIPAPRVMRRHGSARAARPARSRRTGWLTAPSPRVAPPMCGARRTRLMPGSLSLRHSRGLPRRLRRLRRGGPRPSRLSCPACSGSVRATRRRGSASCWDCRDHATARGTGGGGGARGGLVRVVVVAGRA